MKKRIIYFLLAVLMLVGSTFSFAGCRQESSSVAETGEVKMSAAYNAAIKAFKARRYDRAYEIMQKARDMGKSNRMTIEECYVEEYLIKENGDFYTARQVLDELDWPEEKKQVLLDRYGPLSMCEAGNLANFGKIDFDPVTWIVLNIEEMEIEGEMHRVALILTKDVIGSPDGWGTKSNVYGVSDLHCWCETSFKLQLRVNLNETEVNAVIYSPIKTGDQEVLARCFAPSREEIETYLVGDLEQYRKASPTQDAKIQGVTGEYASYYLRNPGKLESGLQYACGVNADGVIGDRFGRSVRSIGGRVCLRVDLGAIQAEEE